MTSVVPTQLARLLDVPGGADWLRRFRCVFLGGAPAWAELLERARSAGIRLAPCYGMTESAAQVAALRPDDFLAGRGGVGTALPHARIAVAGDGRIRIESASLCLGYYPGAREGRAWTTSDRGMLDAAGFLTVLGRADALIFTGGEKVDPAEVEAALMGAGGLSDAHVFGEPHQHWGEAVVAVVSGGRANDESGLRAALTGMLAAHKIPKRFVFLAAIPRTEAGKIDRGALTALLSRQD